MSVKLKIKNSMEKINQRDSFVFYRSYLESIELLSIKKQLLAYKALVKYGLNQEEMENLPPQVAIILKIAKPNIDANIRNYNRRIKNKERKKMSDLKNARSAAAANTKAINRINIVKTPLQELKTEYIVAPIHSGVIGRTQ